MIIKQKGFCLKNWRACPSVHTGIAILVLSFVLITGKAGADVPHKAEEYLAIATSYDEKAKAQEQVIAEHEKMKRDYKKELGPGMRRSQVFLSHKIEKMNKHCDAIIQGSKELAKEYREIAEWHREQAKEGNFQNIK